MYLLWPVRPRSRSDAADAVLGDLAGSCSTSARCASRSMRETRKVTSLPQYLRPRARWPPTPWCRCGSMPSTTAAPFEEAMAAASGRIAGYSVVESLYRDYGGNQWSVPRSWPDGVRSPGVLTVALLQQHPDQSFEEWVTRWHTRISPITEAIQPRMRYVRNAVFRSLTDGRATARGASWRRRGRPSSTSPTPCCSTVPTETRNV